MVMMMDGTAAQALASFSEHTMHDTRHALLDGHFGPAEESCRETKTLFIHHHRSSFPVSFRFAARDARLPWSLLSALTPLQLLPPVALLLSACSSPPRLSSFPQPTHQALGPFHSVAGTHAQVANPGPKIPWRRGTRWGPSQPSVEATGLPRRPVGPSYISEGRTLIQIVDETRVVDKGTFMGRHNAMLECHTTWDRVISACPPSAFCLHEWGR